MNINNNIEDKVKKIIAKQFNVDVNNLNDETSIKKDLNADSLDIVELIISIEEDFNLNILDDDIYKLDTVKSIIDYIKNSKISD